MSTALKLPPVDYIIREQKRLLDLYGGRAGVRDRGGIEAALGRADHLIAYADDPSLFEIVARITHGLATTQCFVDGNKRIAFAVLSQTLRVNGYTLDVAEEAAFQIMMRLAQGELKSEELACWIEDQFQPDPACA